MYFIFKLPAEKTTKLSSYFSWFNFNSFGQNEIKIVIWSLFLLNVKFSVFTIELCPLNFKAALLPPGCLISFMSKSTLLDLHLYNKSSSSNPQPQYSFENPFILSKIYTGHIVTPPKYSSNTIRISFGSKLLAKCTGYSL